MEWRIWNGDITGIRKSCRRSTCGCYDRLSPHWCDGFFAVCAIPKTAEDLECASVSIERYEVYDEVLLLYESDNPRYYLIPEYQNLLHNADDFINSCDAGNFFDVGYETYNVTSDAHYGLDSIVGIDRTVYLTMEVIHRYRTEGSWQFYLFFGGFAFIWFAYAAFSIYVDRNPDEFSDRVIGWFFKDGYVRMSFN